MIICGCITYQDIRHRAVSWLLFPALMITGFLLSFSAAGSWIALLERTGINLLFVLVQLLFLYAYFFLRHGDRLLIGKKIGLGDILFWLAASAFFSFFQFILFYTLSLAFSLIVYLLLFRSPWSESRPTIPLAGLQALFLILFISTLIFL